MNTDKAPPTSKKADERGYRPIDRAAYVGLGSYSLINIAWFIWVFSGAGFGIFNTAILIGLVVPFIALLSSIIFQCYSRQNRFSPLANVLSFLVIGGWFLAVWYIVAAASAAV